MKIYKKVVEVCYEKVKIGQFASNDKSRTVIVKYYLFGVMVWETYTKYIIF